MEATQALEIGSVPLGSSASHTFTVRNRDTTAMSQLKVELRAALEKEYDAQKAAVKYDIPPYADKQPG